jgi:hypothetical protein
VKFYDIPNPKLNAKNSHFGNSYATLEEVIATVRPFLVATGLGVVQTVQFVDGNPVFVSQLLDSEGAVKRQVAFPFDPGKAGPQAVGSALTYARRYGYLLLFDLVGEDDDDAERGEGRGQKASKAKRKPAAKKSAPKATKPAAKPATSDDNFDGDF